MNKHLRYLVPLVVVAFFALGALNTAPHTRLTFPINTGPQSVIIGTFSNSTSTIDTADTELTAQSDTLLWMRPPGLAGAAFAVKWFDSVNVLNVIMQRLVNNEPLDPIVGDTILGATSFSTTGATSVTLTLAPLADAYRFLVNYDTAGNGYDGDSTVVYKIEQQFYNR